MSEELLRARYTFGAESEIRYISELPAVGESVAYRSVLWSVSSARKDPLGFCVVCELVSAAGTKVTRITI